MKQPKIYLTKVLYYDSERRSFNKIRTISGALDIHSPLRHKPEVLVKRNIFGHKWVLKLNETAKEKRRSSFTKVTLYVFVFTAIVLAFLFGLLVFFGSKYLETNYNQREIFFETVPIVNSTNKTNRTDLTKSRNMKYNYLSHNNSKKLESPNLDSNKTDSPCSECVKTREICYQEARHQFPQCRTILDANDPTGCGGLCKLDVQYCKRLVDDLEIYSCIDIERFACSGNEWSCRSSAMCIPVTRRCDGTIECFDRSDEMGCDCDMMNNFRCGQNLSCLPLSKRCDGFVDCWDASDELHCPRICRLDEVACANGLCVPRSKFCDGVQDCEDKSDEPVGCRNTNT